LNPVRLLDIAVMSDALEQARQAAENAQTAVDSGAFADRGEEYESTSSGLKSAVAELQQAREEFVQTARPPPPSPSDLIGAPQKIFPADDKPMSPRTAAKQLSELHRQQKEYIQQWDNALAAVGGGGWNDELTPEQAARLGFGTPVAAPEVPAQPNELDQQRQALAQQQQQVEAQRAYYEQARQAQSLSTDARQMADLVQAGVHKFRAAYPEIKTDADLNLLRGKDPARAAAAERDLGVINGWGLQAEALQRRAVDQVAQVNAKAGEEHDRLFTERHPEFVSDAKEMATLQRQALQTLRDGGFSDQELGRAWTGQDGLFLRDHRVQSFVLEHLNLKNENEALRARLEGAQKGLKPVRDLPPIRKPGVAQDVPAGSYQEVQAKRRALARASTQRAGALAGVDLLQAMRKAGRL
jgi:hypothetical protein